MGPSALFPLSIFIFLLSLQESFGIKCYICDSSLNTTDGAACSDKFDKSKLQSQDCADWCNKRGGFIPAQKNGPPGVVYPATPCPPQFTVCRKIKQSSTSADFNGGNSDDRIIRTCGFGSNSTEQALNFRTAATDKSEVNTCFESDCNAAANLNFSYFTGIGIMLFLMACIVWKMKKVCEICEIWTWILNSNFLGLQNFVWMSTFSFQFWEIILVNFG
jgi:hypothetical protein